MGFHHCPDHYPLCSFCIRCHHSRNVSGPTDGIESIWLRLFGICTHQSPDLVEDKESHPIKPDSHQYYYGFELFIELQRCLDYRSCRISVQSLFFHSLYASINSVRALLDSFGTSLLKILFAGILIVELGNLKFISEIDTSHPSQR